MQQRAVLYYITPISATVPDPLKRPKWKNERKKKITKQDSAESKKKKIEKKWVYVDQDIYTQKKTPSSSCLFLTYLCYSTYRLSLLSKPIRKPAQNLILSNPKKNKSKKK